MKQHSAPAWRQPNGERESDREPLPPTPFRLGSFRVDPTALKISNGIKSSRVERKVMEVLLALARRQGETVTREQLLEDAWQGAYVTDGVLHRVVSLLRSALGDDARDPTYIETIPRVGYRLLQPVEWQQSVAPAQPPGQRASAIRWPGLVAAAIGVIALAAVVAMSFRSSESVEVTVRPLTAEPGYEFDPAISSDGKWLAYAYADEDQDGGIFVSAADGVSQRRLLVPVQPQEVYPRAPGWSSDGNQIAWIETSGLRASPDETCRVRVQPLAAEVPSLSVDCVQAGSLDWSPDDRHLLFDDVDDQGRSRLRQVNVATQESEWLTSPAAGLKDYLARYSPDGERIAFVRYEVSLRSYVVVQEAGGRKVLEYEPSMGFATGVDWLDGDRLVVSVSNGYGIGELWSLSLSNRRLDRLHETHGGNSPATGHGQLVYRRDAVSSGIWELASAAADQDRQRTPRIQSTRLDANPQLAPDGRTIAFASDRSGSPQIWVSTAPGEESVLTDLDVHWLGPPRWNTDGSRIIFEGRSTRGFEVYIAEIASRTVKRAEVSFDRFREPAWSPGGEMMISAPANGTWQLWKQGANQEWLQLTTDGGFVATVSPDREWIYYTKYDQPGLWRMPASGGAESRVLEWVEFGHRRHWVVTPNSIVAVRKTDTGDQLVRVTEGGVEELLDFGEETVVLGVTGSDDSICYSLLEFSGTDIYAVDFRST